MCLLHLQMITTYDIVDLVTNVYLSTASIEACSTSIVIMYTIHSAAASSKLVLI